MGDIVLHGIHPSKKIICTPNARLLQYLFSISANVVDSPATLEVLMAS